MRLICPNIQSLTSVFQKYTETITHSVSGNLRVFVKTF